MKINVDHDRFFKECNAVGLTITRIVNGEAATDHLTAEEQSLLDKVVAAHEKPRSDSARAELDAALTEAQQAEYRACRDEQVKDARRERYTNETDHMILDALAGADAARMADGLGMKQADIEAWQEARKVIQKEIPL